MNRKLFTSIFILVCYTVFSDEPVYDKGTILSWDDTNLQFYKDFLLDELGRTAEMIFVNKISGRQIFYTGVATGGEGVYWIKDGEMKKEISKRYNRYFPSILWHGADIAEIMSSGNSSMYELVFYDFTYNTTTEVVGPHYVVDADKHLVVCTVLERVMVLDLRNSEIVLNIDFYEAVNAEHPIDYHTYTTIRPDIGIDSNRLIINYNFNYDGKEIKDTKIYEFNR
jgi:hypothetical protein